MNDQVDLTAPASKLGSPAYMSPEQAAGNIDQVKAHTDIYGLGAILFEILTGRPPHRLDEQAIKTNRQALLCERIAQGHTPRARQCTERKTGTIPRELDSICAKAMSVRVEDRYATAGPIADEIDRWLVCQPVHAHSYSLFERTILITRRHPGVSI